MKEKRKYEDVYPRALELVERLLPDCAQIEIAGSLRRKCAGVGDIEIVAQPLEFLSDMMGGITQDHSLDVFPWGKYGELKLNGHKQKKIILPDGLGVDLFIVTPPAEWGVILMLRTGSADFSHRLATPKQFGGFLPSFLKMKDGAFVHVRTGEVQSTPTEREVFKLLGMKFIPPEERK